MDVEGILVRQVRNGINELDVGSIIVLVTLLFVYFEFGRIELIKMFKNSK